MVYQYLHTKLEIIVFNKNSVNIDEKVTQKSVSYGKVKSIQVYVIAKNSNTIEVICIDNFGRIKEKRSPPPSLSFWVYLHGCRCAMYTARNINPHPHCSYFIYFYIK